jgi:hypothetical protein
MTQSNPVLEIMLDEEHQKYERVSREVIYRVASRHFPKKCNSCGLVYRTEEAFTRETAQLGEAKTYKTSKIHLFHFLRNCKCNSTLAINVDRKDLDTVEDYYLLETVKKLGERVVSELVQEKKTGEDLMKSSYGQFISLAFSTPVAQKILSDISFVETDDEFKFEIGLNAFRVRYNNWMERRASS